jgi:hypothetical protein
MPTATRIRDHCLARGGRWTTPAGGGYRRLFPELDALDARTTPCTPGPGRRGLRRRRRGRSRSGPTPPTPMPRGRPGGRCSAVRGPRHHRRPLAADPPCRAGRGPQRPQPPANLEPVYGDGPAACRSCTTATTGQAAGRPQRRRPSGRPAPQPPGVALVGDPRNDVHLLMSQLHVAMLPLHNGLVDRLRSDGVAEAELFAEARRRHLALPVGPARGLPARVSGPSWPASCWPAGPGTTARPGRAWIPLEFADAAYRFGHSQIRDRYQVNRDAEPVPLLPDLLGFRPVPAVLPSTGRSCSTCRAAAGPAGQADRRPPGRPASSSSPGHHRASTAATTARWPSATSSAARGSGCRRARRWPAASGSSRSPHEVGLGAAGWWQETPLWFYLLKEAEHPRRRAPGPGRRPAGRARSWSASSTPTASPTGPSTPAGGPPSPPPSRDGSGWPTCSPSGAEVADAAA